MARILKYNDAKIKIAEIIGKRHLKKGDRLPTEREIAEMLGISTISIRRAIEEFQTIGIIQKVQGVGTFLCGELDRREYTSKLGIISICDPGFPSGQEMAQLRKALNKHHADYDIFAVEQELMFSLSDRLAQCDYFLLSGFINPQWLDYLGNQGKRMIQIGFGVDNIPVVRVVFDWQEAFRGVVNRLKNPKTNRFGMLLINSNSASCTPHRNHLFEIIAKETGIDSRPEWRQEVNPAAPFSDIQDYLCRYENQLDVLLVDYHVFSFLGIARLFRDFPLPSKVIVMQTEQVLPSEFNENENFGELYFPESIIDASVKVLYDYSCSFILNHETYKIGPQFTGKAFNPSK
jgi:hypothetical protein